MTKYYVLGLFAGMIITDLSERLSFWESLIASAIVGIIAIGIMRIFFSDFYDD